MGIQKNGIEGEEGGEEEGIEGGEAFAEEKKKVKRKRRYRRVLRSFMLKVLMPMREIIGASISG